MEELIKSLNIYAGMSSDGKIIHEEVQVEPLGNHIYRLMSAPGLALNLAKDDIFSQNNQDGPVTIIKRSKNFNIHIYKTQLSLEDYEDFKHELFNYLEGSIDGISEHNLAITIPSGKKLNQISNFFDNFEKIKGNKWSITNIYKNYEDFSDQTLLDWWVE